MARRLSVIFRIPGDVWRCRAVNQRTSSFWSCCPHTALCLSLLFNRWFLIRTLLEEALYTCSLFIIIANNDICHHLRACYPDLGGNRRPSGRANTIKHLQPLQPHALHLYLYILMIFSSALVLCSCQNDELINFLHPLFMLGYEEGVLASGPLSPQRSVLAQRATRRQQTSLRPQAVWAAPRRDGP